MMLTNETKDLFLSKYSLFGEDKFYKFLINYINNRSSGTGKIKGLSPEIELIDYYEGFLLASRKENSQSLLDIAKIFRKAAHKAYKMLLIQGRVKKNDRFLNLVD